MKKFLNKRNLLIVGISVIIIAAISVTLCLILGNGKPSEREVFIRGDFEYSLIDEYNVEIVGYVGDSKNVSIPTALQGKIVLSIGDYAFASSDIKSVDFGDFIEYIGDYAFAGCTNLTEIVFSEDLKEIGNGAFQECSEIKEIMLPETTRKIGNYSFAGCKMLSDIEFPKALQSIGVRAFSNCVNIEALSISSDSVSRVPLRPKK